MILPTANDSHASFGTAIRSFAIAAYHIAVYPENLVLALDASPPWTKSCRILNLSASAGIQ